MRIKSILGNSFLALSLLAASLNLGCASQTTEQPTTTEDDSGEDYNALPKKAIALLEDLHWDPKWKEMSDLPQEYIQDSFNFLSDEPRFEAIAHFIKNVLLPQKELFNAMLGVKPGEKITLFKNYEPNAFRQFCILINQSLVASTDDPDDKNNVVFKQSDENTSELSATVNGVDYSPLLVESEKIKSIFRNITYVAFTRSNENPNLFSATTKDAHFVINFLAPEYDNENPSIHYSLFTVENGVKGSELYNSIFPLFVPEGYDGDVELDKSESKEQIPSEQKE